MTTARRTVGAVELRTQPGVYHIGRLRDRRWTAVCGAVGPWSVWTRRAEQPQYVGVIDPDSTECSECAEAYRAGW